MDGGMGFACGMNELAKGDANNEKKSGEEVKNFDSIDLIKALVTTIFSSKENK